MIPHSKHKKLIIVLVGVLLLGCAQTESSKDDNETNAISRMSTTGGPIVRLQIGIDSINKASNGLYDLLLHWTDPGVDTTIYDYLLIMNVYKDTSMTDLDSIIYRTTKLRTESIRIFYGDSLVSTKMINVKLAIVDTNKTDTIELLGGNDVGRFCDSNISEDVIFLKTMNTTQINNLCDERTEIPCQYIAFGDTSLLWQHNNTIDTISIGQFEHFNIYPIDEIKNCLCDTNNLFIKDRLIACIDTLKPLYYSTSIHQLPDSLICDY